MTAWKVLILFKENVCPSSKTSRRKIFNVRHVTEMICPKLCPDLDRRKVNFGCYRLHRTATRNFILVNLTLGRTRKFIPPPWYKGGGGVVDETPPQSYVAVFRNDFTFSGKPLIFSTRWGIFYGWWRCWRTVTSLIMVAILAAISDFTKN